MNSHLTALQQALPTWVRLERRAGEPVVRERLGDGVAVIDIRDFPEQQPDSVRADVHFVVVAPTEGLPEREDLIAMVLLALLDDGEFQSLTPEDLAGGPSYITLGGWLGSQDLALMLIGAVELVGIAKAITPATFRVTGEDADALAGGGMVMLGPSRCWTES